MRPRNVRAGVSKALEDVVLRAMARAPDDRYPTASAFRGAMLAAERGGTPLVPLTFGSGRGPTDATVATPRVDTDRTPPGSSPPTFVRTERGWLVPTVAIVLVAAALIIAGVLVAGGGGLPHIGNNTSNSSASNANAATIADAKAFDPFGDGAENDDRADAVTDGDPATVWQTEGYDDQAIKTKPGVGLYVTLNKAVALAAVKVNSPTSGWSAEIYVAETPKGDVASWGAPVSTKSHIAAGATTFELGGKKGGVVLIWITDLGNDPPDDSGRFHARIADVSIAQK